MNNEQYNIFIIYLISFILIIISLLYRYSIKKDEIFLNYKFEGLNGWNISHIILYICLAYCAPNYILYLIIIGILWELGEYYFENKIQYIYYNKLDILYNIIGCIIGYILYKIYPNKIDLYQLFKNKFINK